MSIKVVLEMKTTEIEANMDMEAVGTPTEAKIDMEGAHFPPPVTVSVETSESEERDVDNISPDMVMMATHSNVCDDRPNTNDSLDGVIPTDATNEASAENPGSEQCSQVRWTIDSGDTEPLPVPMIPPDSSWIYPKRMLVSTFIKGGTPKPSVSPLGMSKQKPLPLDRASTTPFTHQDGASDKVPPHSESTTVGVITMRKHRI